MSMTQSFEGDKIYFQNDLQQNLKDGDKTLLKFLDSADEYVRQNELNLPLEHHAREILPDPSCVTDPILELDLKQANINTVIWASGFGLDYDWLQVNTFNDQGRPVHKQGISDERGVYFLGLPYLTGRGSSFIWGVWYDAKHIADHIQIQRSYLDYQTDKDSLDHSA